MGNHNYTKCDKFEFLFRCTLITHPIDLLARNLALEITDKCNLAVLDEYRMDKFLLDRGFKECLESIRPTRDRCRALVYFSRGTFFCLP